MTLRSIFGTGEIPETQAVQELRAEIDRLTRERDEAREACPCVRMQDHFGDTLLEAINFTVGRMFALESENTKVTRERDEARAVISRYARAYGPHMDGTFNSWRLTGCFGSGRDIFEAIAKSEKATELDDT